MTCATFCLGPFDYISSQKIFDMQAGGWTLWYSYKCPKCGCCMASEVARLSVDGSLLSVRDKETHEWLEVAV